MSRKFSSAAKYLKNLVWDVRTRANVSGFQTSLESAVKDNPSLARKVTKATIDGDPHETRKRDGTVDPVHVSGKLLTSSDRRLTSYHAYGDGRVEFSQKKYNPDVSSSSGGRASGDAPAFKTGLTWEMSQDNTCAMWWDGTTWQFGQWSDEHNLWVAHFNGHWYAWQ